MKNVWKKVVVGAMVGLVSPIALALDVPMFAASQTGNGGTPLGNITLTQSSYGLLIIPALKGLTPGIHGLHVHEVPSCDNFAEAAGGHLDPAKTGEHLGPYNNNGHLGDMPVLIVDKNGTATLPLLAPRLSLIATEGHSLVIHAEGDNYTDTPPMGGSGDRIACGIIPVEAGTQLPVSTPATTTTTTTTTTAPPTMPAVTPSTTPSAATTPVPQQVPAATTPAAPQLPAGMQLLHPRQGGTPAATPPQGLAPAASSPSAPPSTTNDIQSKQNVQKNVQLSSTDKLREIQAIRKAREQLQQQANAGGS